MKAAFITAAGPADTIQYGDLPDPQPQSTEVLIQMHAVAVNPIDTYVRGGMVPKELPFPYIVGADVAGQVVAIGPEVTEFAVGDRVWSCVWRDPVGQGCFSELVCIDQAWVYPLPDQVEYQTAAALALVGITAHLGLQREAAVQPGETVFVNGGSGGVGSTVVQMAKILGATVITTAGDDTKAQLCRDLGADHVINYKTQDLASVLSDLAPTGVDVWYDVTRAQDLVTAVDALAVGGRLVLISGRGENGEFPIGPFYVKCCKAFGFQMTLASSADRRVCAEAMNMWMASGQLKPRIDRVLPLSQTAQAHQLQEDATISLSGGLAGKIVLVPDNG